MKLRYLILTVAASLFILTACSKGPGELEGTWRLDGVLPMNVTYRKGQEESMGVITPVSFRHEGNHVYVTYEGGFMKGQTIRFTRVNRNTYRSELGTLTRVR